MMSGNVFDEVVTDHVNRLIEERARTQSMAGLYNRVIRQIERPLIEACLKRTGGNQLRAAEILGINRNTLRKKIRYLGLE